MNEALHLARLRKRTHEEAAALKITCGPFGCLAFLDVPSAADPSLPVLEGLGMLVEPEPSHSFQEVAHLQKHAAFWSLHIKPIARLIVMATAGAADNRQAESTASV